ncbi:MAG: hypothetical protein HeimC3_50960 [Candidatus Heimdallarchaeota archaeon LC_3]|nr:MAG: hypothetical protein HeimC3_50960 [Candidatus Heimdallarchaeota archaeon LC_3]
MESQIGLSFVGLASNGLIPLISTILPFIKSRNDVESFLLQFSIPLGMMLGQGDNYFTHKLYGGFPVTNNPNWIAFTYPFFILDETIKSPRGHQNMYTFAILFLPQKFEIINKGNVESMFQTFIKKLSNIDELLQHKTINKLLKKFSDYFEKEISEISAPQNFYSVKSKIQLPEESKNEIENESKIPNKIALPLLLHSVFHGYEKSTLEVLGNLESTVDYKSEIATLEILEQFKFFDRIDYPVTTIQQALDLACQHLSEIGETVNIKPVSENKLEIDITCQLAKDVHPFLDVDKCLWMRYIASILRKVLPKDKEILVHSSEYDPDGSKSIIEIVSKRIYKKIKD